MSKFREDWRELWDGWWGRYNKIIRGLVSGIMMLGITSGALYLLVRIPEVGKWLSGPTPHRIVCIIFALFASACFIWWVCYGILWLFPCWRRKE